MPSLDEIFRNTAPSKPLHKESYRQLSDPIKKIGYQYQVGILRFAYVADLFCLFCRSCFLLWLRGSLSHTKGTSSNEFSVTIWQYVH